MRRLVTIDAISCSTEMLSLKATSLTPLGVPGLHELPDVLDRHFANADHARLAAWLDGGAVDLDARWSVMSTNGSRYITTLLEEAMVAGRQNGFFHTVTIDFLLQRGLTIDLRGHARRTALMTASRYDWSIMVELLHVRKASIDLQDKDGYTALMHASARGKLGIVEYLLAEAGANTALRDSNGKTALQLADSSKCTQIAELIETWPRSAYEARCSKKELIKSRQRAKQEEAVSVKEETEEEAKEEAKARRLNKVRQSVKQEAASVKEEATEATEAKEEAKEEAAKSDDTEEHLAMNLEEKEEKKKAKRDRQKHRKERKREDARRKEREGGNARQHQLEAQSSNASAVAVQSPGLVQAGVPQPVLAPAPLEPFEPLEPAVLPPPAAPSPQQTPASPAPVPPAPTTVIPLADALAHASLNVACPPAPESTVGGETTCIICFTNPKTHAAVPCGHQCACESCSAQMEACPYCREPAKMWMHTRVV